MIDRVWLWLLPWLQFSRRVGWAVKAPRDLGLAPRVPQLNQCNTECDKESESMLPFLRTENNLNIQTLNCSCVTTCDYQVSLPPWYCSTVSGKSRVLMGRTSSCDRTKTPEMLREKFMSVDSLWLSSSRNDARIQDMMWDSCRAISSVEASEVRRVLARALGWHFYLSKQLCATLCNESAWKCYKSLLCQRWATISRHRPKLLNSKLAEGWLWLLTGIALIY